ncbi:Inner membrane metabolite transport protein YhjE [Jeotgalicoccus saudimassiliensis]|uniref:Putative proline/betaine transporter n=1 Tax=Jeotgalicoccus saudimassiliensis TaxID=1461582 RepID=A0A078M660_9STAP|nr:MFS transporter [Jeotgalicoccus saudimassiliensis]CEA02938.1 Inner membrane metabolite transport protein YhjE [Jeotgalicoccus saudimassiliensis]
MDKKLRRKVLSASLIGSSIEWFDFFLYAAVASIIFNTQFFVTDDAFLSTILAYFGLALSFFIRPLGGVIFAHIGDRIGRKKTLIITLSLMGFATAGIGLLPTYAQIGIAAPLLLLLFRLIQGLGIGGEWGGALLLATEYAPKKQRGLFGSFPQMGIPIGLVLAYGFFFLLTWAMPEEMFLAWGWRIPFIFSLLLVVVGLLIRKGLDETPAFVQMQKEAAEKNEVRRLPIVEIFKKHPKEVLITTGAKFVETGPFYIFTTFIVGYGVSSLDVSFEFMMLSIMAVSVLTTIMIPVMGSLSDRIGRRKMFLIGATAMLIYAFPYFFIVNTHEPMLVILATFIGLVVIWPPITAILGTMFSESFSKEVRYTGVTLGYQIGAAVAGGSAPLIAEFLMNQFNGSSIPVSLYIVMTAIVSLIAVFAMRGESAQDKEDRLMNAE